MGESFRSHAAVWRWVSSGTVAALAMALAIAVPAVAVAQSETPGAAQPSGSTPASTAPPHFCPDPTGGACLGPLDSGTYSSGGFTAPITYTVPDGWSNANDQLGEFLLLPPGQSRAGVDAGYSNYIGIYWDVRAPKQDCSSAPDPGVAPDATALATWMAALPGLQSDGPHPTSVGSMGGYTVDVRMDPAWTGKCPQIWDSPFVDLLVGDGKLSDFEHGIAAGLAYRYIFLDVPAHAGQCEGGTTCPLAIEIGYTPRSQTFDEYLQQVSPVIASLALAPAPQGPPATLPPDGIYHAVVTPEQLEQIGASAMVPDNAGTLDLTVAGDALTVHWSGIHAPYDCTASQSVQGDRVLVAWKTGCSGDFAYQWTAADDAMVWSTPEFPGPDTVLFGHRWAVGPSPSPSP